MSFYHMICCLSFAASGTLTGFIVGYCLGYDKCYQENVDSENENFESGE